MKVVAALSFLLLGFCQAGVILNGTTSSEYDGMELAMNAGFFQGDIVLTDDQERAMFGPLFGAMDVQNDERNVRKDATYLWPDSTIPYMFTPGDFDSSDQALVNGWLAELSDVSCVKFVPRTNQRDYVRIFNGNGCFSSVGRVFNEQTLSLTKTLPYPNGHCMFRKTVVHEFLHAAGFWHEQSRLDRDQYLNVYLNNVETSMKHNFNKVNPVEAKTIGRYDYLSVMQYGSKSFSKNGKNTMTRKNGSTKLGQPFDGFVTKSDISKLKNLYKCGRTTPRPAGCRDSTGNEALCKQLAAIPNRCDGADMQQWCKKSCNVGCS